MDFGPTHVSRREASVVKVDAINLDLHEMSFYGISRKIVCSDIKVKTIIAPCPNPYNPLRNRHKSL